MEHFALLYYGLSFTTGCVPIGIALLINLLQTNRQA
jgi:hypothetical protein